MIDNRWTEIRTQRNQTGQHIDYPGYIRNIFPRFTINKKNSKRHQMACYIPNSWHNQDEKYVEKKLHMFSAVAEITFVMKNLDVYV